MDARGGIPMAGERRMGSHWRGEKKGVKKCRSRGNGRKKSGRLYGGGAGGYVERGAGEGRSGEGGGGGGMEEKSRAGGGGRTKEG